MGGGGERLTPFLDISNKQKKVHMRCRVSQSPCHFIISFYPSLCLSREDGACTMAVGRDEEARTEMDE